LNFYINLYKELTDFHMSSNDILNGMSNIINAQNIKQGVNYEEIEKAMVKNGVVARSTDPSDRFKRELSNLAKTLKISFDSPTRNSPMRNSPMRNLLVRSSPTRNSPIRTPGRSPYKSPSKLSYSQPEYDNVDLDDPENANYDDPDDPNNIPEQYDESGENMNPDDDQTDYQDNAEDYQDDNPDDVDGGQDSSNNPFRNFNYDDNHPISSPSRSKNRSELSMRTEEERNHNQIKNVIKNMGGNNNIISLEQAKKEDDKTIMLEEIDSLRASLEEENAHGLDKIPKVNQDSTIDEVENVLKRLRLKNDRSRYTSLADEILLWGATGMEELFNGERVWMGKYKIDLRGWNKEVQVKLRRMRHDTSTLVSGIMHDYNIGSGMRIILELVPNMFMFAKRKKVNYGKPDLYSDSDISNAMNNIQNYDN
jgi:hypothetical protein